ncbi:MAG: hypothetical protein ACKVGZ_15095, partial [Alphaproteobacteria bacterium]
MMGGGGKVQANKIIRDVTYEPDLIIDAWPLIRKLHPTAHNQIRAGFGVKNKTAVVASDPVGDYVRLVDEGGKTALQVRGGPNAGKFQTVLVFKDTVNRTAEQMVADGTLFVRGLRSMAEAIATRFKGQKKYADKFGLELVAYEGGKHPAAAVWGVYR